MTADLATLHVPGPIATALTEYVWNEAAAGRLAIQRCRACGHAVFYPRAICPNCWAGKLEWETASGRGTLRSFTVVHRPGHPSWAPAAPYVVGLVALAEGPTMTSLIVGHIEPAVGARVHLEPTDVAGRILPAFRIVDGNTGDKA